MIAPRKRMGNDHQKNYGQKQNETKNVRNE